MIKNALELTPFPQPDVVPLNRPVVLMHGLGIFSAVGRKGQMHEQAMHLRKHGVTAYAPNVPPYNTIAVRAEVWKDRLEIIQQETQAETVHLVAHSMGGLDARYMIAHMDGEDYIASLTTVSTPHRGSAIASWVLEQPDRIRTWITEIMNWLGEQAYEQAPSDTLAAFAELTPDYVQNSFNPSVPDSDEVPIRSYAGKAGKDTDIPINPLLALYNAKLYEHEGVNDGFVSVESAKWGEFIGTLEADHASQVGLKRGSLREFDPNAFYLSIARSLAEDFAEPPEGSSQTSTPVDGVGKETPHPSSPSSPPSP